MFASGHTNHTRIPITHPLIIISNLSSTLPMYITLDTRHLTPDISPFFSPPWPSVTFFGSTVIGEAMRR
jgi:hypothetical protein